LAGDTSYSHAPNATAKRASCMPGTRTTASGFSVAVNALASLISRQWATVGTARRVVSRSCAPGSNGARAVPCRSNREVCMSGRTSVSWGCLPITRRCESWGRVTPENTDQISIMLICGGNAEIDSLALVGGQFVDKARASDPPQERKLPISVIIGACTCPLFTQKRTFAVFTRSPRRRGKAVSQVPPGQMLSRS
jgi:hypothetical protein